MTPAARPSEPSREAIRSALAMLPALREMLALARKGPLVHDTETNRSFPTEKDSSGAIREFPWTFHDHELMVGAVNALPTLLDALDSFRASAPPDAPVCPECDRPFYEIVRVAPGILSRISEGGGPGGSQPTLYPCTNAGHFQAPPPASPDKSRGCVVAFCEAHADLEIIPGPFCPYCSMGQVYADGVKMGHQGEKAVQRDRAAREEPPAARKAGNVEVLKARIAEIRDRLKGDEETSHIDFDKALLAFVGDDEVTKAHEELCPWFA